MKNIILTTLLILFFFNAYPQETYGVCIGIGYYHNGKNINANKDAVAYHSLFKKGNAISIIDNSNTTNPSFNDIKKWSSSHLNKNKVKSDDIFHLFLAMHGVVVNNNYHLCLSKYDNKKQYNDQNYLTGNFIDEVVKAYEKKGVQVVIVVDACKSGRLAEIIASEIRLLSSGKDENSYEQYEGKGGLFSKYLIEAIEKYTEYGDIKEYITKKFNENRVQNPVFSPKVADADIWIRPITTGYQDIDTPRLDDLLKIDKLFRTAIAENDYIETKKSAYHYYKEAENIYQTNYKNTENEFQAYMFTSDMFVALVDSIVEETHKIKIAYINGSDDNQELERAIILSDTVKSLTSDLIYPNNDIANHLFFKSAYLTASNPYDPDKLEQAKTLIDSAITLYPVAYSFYYQAGVVNYHQDNFEEAKRNFKIYLKYIPGDSSNRRILENNKPRNLYATNYKKSNGYNNSISTYMGNDNYVEYIDTANLKNTFEISSKKIEFPLKNSSFSKDEVFIYDYNDDRVKPKEVKIDDNEISILFENELEYGFYWILIETKNTKQSLDFYIE